MRKTVIGWTVLLIVGLCVGSTFGQSGSRRFRQPLPRTPQPVPFEKQFWDYLVQVGFRNWSPWPGKPAEHYAAEKPADAHGELLKTYVDRKVAENPTDPPARAIIVMENYTSEKELRWLDIMYRSAGYSPETGDWYWIRYNADGTVASEGNTQLAGRVQKYIDCHQQADGKDFLFSNDPAPTK